MKKRLLAVFLICVMAMSFAVPAMAYDVVVAETICDATEQGLSGGHDNTPFTEMTQAYFRTYHGVLQFRIWSLTYGRWLTPWTNV